MGDNTANTNVIASRRPDLRDRRGRRPAGGADRRARDGRRSDFGGTLGGSFTAHPKRDPVTGELHAVVYYWEWDHVQYVVVGTDGRVRRTVNVPVPGGPMVHDCAITGTLRRGARPARHLRPRDGRDRARRFPYAWNPDYGRASACCRAKATRDEIRWFEVEPCYVFHPLNAYDRGRAGRASTSSVTRGCSRRTTRGPNEGRRCSSAGRSTRRAAAPGEQLARRPRQEFPRHDERLIGRRHRYGYAATFDDAPPRPRSSSTTSTAGTSEVHDYGRTGVTLEPVFVPRSPRRRRGRRLGHGLRLRRRHRTQRRRDPRRAGLHRRRRSRRSTSPTACRSASTATGCRTSRRRRHGRPAPGRRTGLPPERRSP